MDTLSNNLFDIQVLMESGGMILWVILFASITMWMLIIERYLYVYHFYPKELALLIEQWQQRSDQESWYAQQIKRGMIANMSSKLQRYLLTIRTLTVALPMLGLLGTVAGMITTFDVLTVFGTGNARGMAGGISIALITTMGGLLTSLSGLYFSTQLEQYTNRLISNINEVLRRDNASVDVTMAEVAK